MHTEELESLLARARSVGRRRFGNRITLYLPGMFVMDGMRGRYPAISITGGNCGLGCDHCGGEILKTMPAAIDPQALIDRCLRLRDEGVDGFLITGGSDGRGRLPWSRFYGALAEVKRKAGLPLSVHSGMVDRDTARALKDAGVDQALLDVAGAEETWREVIHLEDGAALLRESLAALREAGLEVIPHIVIGLHFGRVLGERRALEILRETPPSLLVWVVFMPMGCTPMAGLAPPPVEEAARLLAESRLLFPETEIALGCARPRGPYRQALERRAIEAGVNRIALYSEETADYARALGYAVEVRPTCCSISVSESRPKAGQDCPPHEEKQ